MRTNVEINDILMRQAQKLSGIKTKKAVVQEALQMYVRLLRQRNVRKLRGKLEWQGNLGQTREARIAGTR